MLRDPPLQVRQEEDKNEIITLSQLIEKIDDAVKPAEPSPVKINSPQPQEK